MGSLIGLRDAPPHWRVRNNSSERTGVQIYKDLGFSNICRPVAQDLMIDLGSIYFPILITRIHISVSRREAA